MRPAFSQLSPYAPIIQHSSASPLITAATFIVIFAEANDFIVFGNGFDSQTQALQFFNQAHGMMPEHLVLQSARS